MPDYPTPPIEVSSNTTPFAAAARYLIVTLGAFAVGRGWVKAEELPGIATTLVTVGTVIYGLWRTHKTKQSLVVTADAAPNSVAKVV